MNNDVLTKYTELILQGHRDLFDIEFRGLTFICKPLTYYQYQLCMAMEEAISAPDSNEVLLKMTVLYPDREGLLAWLCDDDTMAADPDLLAEQVLIRSTLKDQEDILKLYNEVRGSVESNFMSLVQIYICTAFKSFTPADVDRMSMRETLEMLVKAEEVIGKQINLEAMFGIEDPNTPNRRPGGMPVPEGMETTDMLAQENAGNIMMDAFGHGG